MPTPGQHDVARTLLTKARGDELALARLAADPDIPDDIVGFHAQQAVEKLFKAVLSAHGIGYNRTHNLSYLKALLEDGQIERPADIDTLEELTPWAVEFRYDEAHHATLDRARTVEMVTTARRWAEAAILGVPHDQA